MVNVVGFRGKVFNLLLRYRVNSKGKIVSVIGGEIEEDKTSWDGSVEIIEYFSGVDRMRFSRLVRRFLIDKRNFRILILVSSLIQNRLIILEILEMDVKKELDEFEIINKKFENLIDFLNGFLSKSKQDVSEEGNDR